MKLRNLLSVHARNITFVGDASGAKYTDDFRTHWDALPGWIRERYEQMAAMGGLF